MVSTIPMSKLVAMPKERSLLRATSTFSLTGTVASGVTIGGVLVLLVVWALLLLSVFCSLRGRTNWRRRRRRTRRRARRISFRYCELFSHGKVRLMLLSGRSNRLGDNGQPILKPVT